MRAAALVLVVLLVASLAGCGAKPPPTTTSPSVQPTGRIEGRVLDDAQAVIPGAEVRVLLTDLLVTTDEEGYYVFPAAPAGPVRVVASADDHTSQTKNGVLSSKGKLTLNFVIAPIATVKPYTDPRQFSGTIVCGLPQGVACPSDPMTPTEEAGPFRFEVAPGLSGIVFELEWESPAANVNEQLAFDVQAASSAGCGARYNGASGTSILRLVVLEGFPISGGHQCVFVSSPSDSATAQQEYTMHYTLFYHEPPPEGFTALV